MELFSDDSRISRFEPFEVKTKNLVFTDDKDRILPIGNVKKLSKDNIALDYILKHDTVKLLKDGDRLFVVTVDGDLELPSENFHVDEQLELF